MGAPAGTGWSAQLGAKDRHGVEPTVAPSLAPGRPAQLGAKFAGFVQSRSAQPGAKPVRPAWG